MSSLEMALGNLALQKRAWVMAARPKTLVAAAIPVIIGAGVAVLFGGNFDLALITSALFFALSIQIACNFFNDALDYQKGADTEKRLGPKRVVQSGLLPAESVIGAACLILAAAFIFATPMLLAGGVKILGVMIFSALFAFAYTGGPFPIAYLGLGELFVVPCFGILPIVTLHTLLGGRDLGAATLAGLQIGCLAALLLSINNARDVEEDRRSGKRTLAVRFGEAFSKVEIAFFTFFPFVLGIVWMLLGKSFLFFMPFLMFPIGFSLVRNLKRERPSPIYNAFLGQAALLLLLFGALLTVGIVVECCFY